MSSLSDTSNVEELKKAVQSLKFENENLRLAIWKHEKRPSRKIGLTLLLFGANALGISIFFASSVLAFIGLSLTFWGALLLFIRPSKYVRSEIFNATTISSVTAIGRIIKALGYQGNGVYLPPRRLKELHEGMLFVPFSKEIIVPPVEELSQEKIFANPPGIFLFPIGQGLVNLFEEKLGTSFLKVNIDYLQEKMPKLLVEGLEFLEKFELDTSENSIVVKMKGAFHRNICEEVKKATNLSWFDCPLCSAIACALTRATGKAVTVAKTDFGTDDSAEIHYRLIEV